jgi:AraC family transcriptional regulator, regulatory protein of adaptative response / methylated-DNA-[protein]-cysteine methyltransferase
MTTGDYPRIEQAILYLDEHAERQPSLDEVARAARLSPYHFQRVFRRWVGISPKRFLQVVTLNRAKRALDGEASVLDAALEAGLSGPARLHDLFITHDALSPGQYKRRGEDLVLRYGFVESPFGDCLLACSPLGIFWLSFVIGGGRTQALAELKERWPLAELTRDETAVQPFADRAFRSLKPGGRGGDSKSSNDAEPIALHLQGTNFQVQVWRALLSIPPGETVGYGEIARRIGHPGASRAVGTALNSNPVAFLIPCHRVIRSTGALGGYRWGLPRKQVMLAWEQARAAGSGD